VLAVRESRFAGGGVGVVPSALSVPTVGTAVTSGTGLAQYRRDDVTVSTAGSHARQRRRVAYRISI